MRAARRGRESREGAGEALSLAAPLCAERRALPASFPGPRARPPQPPPPARRVPPHPRRAPSHPPGPTRRAPAWAAAAAAAAARPPPSAVSRAAGCTLHCSAAAARGGRPGGWEVSARPPGRAYRSGGPSLRERCGPRRGARGCRAPSTGGCRHAGASFWLLGTRSCSAPLASSVTMDISLLCRPLRALWEAAGAVAAARLRGCPGDRLGSGRAVAAAATVAVTAVAAAGERRTRRTRGRSRSCSVCPRGHLEFPTTNQASCLPRRRRLDSPQLVCAGGPLPWDLRSSCSQSGYYRSPVDLEGHG